MDNYGGAIVYPSGSVHVTGQNPYLIDILHGSTTAYVGKESPIAEEAESEGASGKTSREAIISSKKAALISAIQTRDNVRVGFVGSGAMFSNKWWETEVMRSATTG
jgi:oligosaccharyltransferase complex subunit beta